MSIELKNESVEGCSIIQLMNKADEEGIKFTDATVELLYNNNPENRIKAIEKYWNFIKANLCILNKCGIDSKNVMELINTF